MKLSVSIRFPDEVIHSDIKSIYCHRDIFRNKFFKLSFKLLLLAFQITQQPIVSTTLRRFNLLNVSLKLSLDCK